jgi:hypothetical protein
VKPNYVRPRASGAVGEIAAAMGVVGVVHARRARPLENGHGLLPGRPLVRSPHRPCRHAGRAGRRRGERLGGQAADKARSAQGGKESSGDCEACQPAAPRIAKAPARPSPGRALAATKRIGVDSRPGSWCPGLSIPAQLMGQRVRAERRATHCARQETIPTGNGDRSRNASGSVR